MNSLTDNNVKKHIVEKLNCLENLSSIRGGSIFLFFCFFLIRKKSKKSNSFINNPNDYE